MKKASIAFVALACTALAMPALAQKGDHPGRGGKGQGNDQGHGQGQGPGRDQAAGPQGTIVVADRDRVTVHDYYRAQYAGGNCPPGLAKKNNGCLPPGQAKKLWAIGRPLPGSVVFHPLPGPLLVQLTPPPAGYQYVQVANDILLMAVGTRMIAAAVADLGAM